MRKINASEIRHDSAAHTGANRGKINPRFQAKDKACTMNVITVCLRNVLLKAQREAKFLQRQYIFIRSCDDVKA